MSSDNLFASESQEMGEIIQISSSPSQEVVSQPDNDSPPLSSQEIERLLEVTPSQAEAAAAPDDAPEDPVEEFKIKCNKEVAAHASKIEEFIQSGQSDQGGPYIYGYKIPE